MIVASVSDFREAARRRLPRFLFEYIDGGAYSEVTLRRNVDDLSSIALRQRVLRDVSSLDLSTELFGRKQALPLALASLGDILDHAQARAVLQRHLPTLVSRPEVEQQARGMTLLMVRGYLPDLTDAKMEAIDNELRQIPLKSSAFTRCADP